MEIFLIAYVGILWTMFCVVVFASERQIPIWMLIALIVTTDPVLVILTWAVHTIKQNQQRTIRRNNYEWI